MLRISRSVESGVEMLSLEGRLLAPWSGALLAELATAATKRPVGRLNLAGLTYMDAAGTDLLRKLQRTGIELTGASAFIRALLEPPAP
jgi:ABC-type transporter Mla MlaB component